MISNQFLGMGVDFASTFESANGSISHVTNKCPNSELLPKIDSSWPWWVIVALVIPLKYSIFPQVRLYDFNMTWPFFEG